MKKRIQYILSVIFFSASGLYLSAQEYVYKSYTAADGLPSSEILAIAKDDKGYLWIGTANGVSKYDGYTFQNFSYAIDNSLVGFVNVIKQYKSNYLLIGTTTGLFVAINNNIIKLNFDSLLTGSVSDIFIETDGSVLFATGIGPLKIPAGDIDISGNKKLNLSQYILPAWKGNNNTANTSANLISKCSDGAIYIAQDYSIYRLYKTHFKLIYAHKNIEEHDKILSLFPVSKSVVYFDGALSEMNKIENGEYENIFRERRYTPGLNAGKDSIWYAGTSGIFCFHPSLAQASVFINTMDADIYWPSMMIKEKDFFWLATHDGLFKIKPSLFGEFTGNAYKGLDETYSAYQLKNNTLLFGGNRGKLFAKNDFTVSNFLPNNQTAFPLAEIRCMYEDDKNRLWIGSGYQGITMYSNGKLKNFNKKDGLIINSINSFFISANKTMYGIGDNGLSKINFYKNDSIFFNTYPYATKISQHARFYDAIEAPDGTIWTSGEEGIFFLKNGSLKEFKLLNKPIQATDIKIDKDENVWVAINGEGIVQCQFNSSNNLFLVKKYNLQDGLNTLSYLRLLVDADNNIWAGSAKGLSCIVRNGTLKDRILNFDQKDGFLKPGFSYLNFYEDKIGTIWVTTPGGTTSFNPEKLLVDAKRPEIFITGIHFLKDDKKNIITDSFFKNENNKLLQLLYNNNTVQVTFSAIDFANPENMSYFYKLEGLDTAWVNSGEERTITFQNLSPGKYKFLVKALNNKGQWSNSVGSFSFIISPPFWQRWWFIALCISVLSGLIYLLYKRRVNYIREKESQKTAIEKLKAINYQYQLEIEQVINFFASSINEQESIDDMLWDVAKNCISKLGFEDCVIYLKDESRNVLIQKAAWGPKTTDENNILNPIEIPIGKGIVGSVATDGKPAIIADTSLDARYIADDYNRLSELAVPIVDDGKVIGVIDSEHHEKNFYTQRHLQILTTVASLCSEKMDKMKAEQQTREKQLEVLQLSSDLASSQLTALRAQMNPHFIFNALNSIQQFVLQGNVDEANRYLSKFSKLQREILNNSDQQFITLEKEKEILEIYLELEQLRFKDGFSFEILVDEAIDTDEIMIPPMIAQPFVENAIWHGLMPKAGNKKLLIAFTLKNEEQLICTITDNGIGREAASKIKANKNTGLQHSSRGLLLVYDRLQILQKQLNKPFNVTFADIKNPNGDSAGTEVTINLFSGG